MSLADPKLVKLADEGDDAPLAMPKGLSAPDQRKWLVSTIKTALAAESEAQQTVSTAQTECASRSKQVGMLLLEAKRLHPKTFGEILLQAGLKLSRAYDLMRLAGGRTTDEEIRKETRDRVERHRAKKKKVSNDAAQATPAAMAKAQPEPSVTSPFVTESAEQAENPTEDSAPPASSWRAHEDLTYLKAVIERMSYERVHELSLWLTNHLIAIRPGV